MISPKASTGAALRQARAEGLTLLGADNKTGYYGVCPNKSSKSKRYVAQVSRGGKSVYLGCFATAEEAALCVAWSPEGKAAVERWAAMESDSVVKQEEVVPPMPAGAFVKLEHVDEVGVKESTRSKRQRSNW